MAKASGKSKHGEIVSHLKAEHGVGHGYADLIAQRFLQGEAPAAGGDDLVEVQYFEIQDAAKAAPKVDFRGRKP